MIWYGWDCNIATVFSLTGATCVCIVCFIFPTLVYLRLHSTRFINTLQDVSSRAAVGVVSSITTPLVVSISGDNINKGANHHHNTILSNSPSSSASNSKQLSHHHHDGDDALAPLIGASIQPLTRRHLCYIWSILAIGVICSGLSLVVIIPALAGSSQD
jgi:hypothetical protein